jgi:hypothetical protein
VWVRAWVIEHPANVSDGSSTSFRAQTARFRFSPDCGHIAASHRSATKSADARRGAAVGGELRQAAKPTASKGVEYKRDTSHRCGRCLSLRLVTIAQTAFSDRPTWVSLSDPKTLRATVVF